MTISSRKCSICGQVTIEADRLACSRCMWSPFDTSDQYPDEDETDSYEPEPTLDLDEDLSEG